MIEKKRDEDDKEKKGQLGKGYGCEEDECSWVWVFGYVFLGNGILGLGFSIVSMRVKLIIY